MLHKIALSFIALSLVLNMSATQVFADGSYGSYGSGSDTPKSETPKEEVKHEPVGAGLGDLSFMEFAMLVGVVGAGLFVIAKKTESVYWLDR